MYRKTNLLIIGAGPFGLALAAYVKSLNMNHLVVGRPMEFWKNNMPDGMFLRSASDWSLDPTDRASILHYLETLEKTPADVEPLSRAFYLDYAQWFQEQHGLKSLPSYVNKLYKINQRFKALLDNGHVIEANHVVVAVGMGYFQHLPAELTELLPQGRFRHTAEAVQLQGLKAKRVLILGGRQSAFEWTALLNEAGAEEVHVVYRHESPQFAVSDWAWVPPLVKAMVDKPGWFRQLSREEKEAICMQLWVDGQLKVEDWLEKRVLRPNTHIYPKTKLVSCTERLDGVMYIGLDNGASFSVEDVILATGYKMDLERISFLLKGNLLNRIAIDNGFPVLDEHFQSSVKGLYFTGMAATQDFGPFFGFTVAVQASAKLIGDSIVTKGIQDVSEGNARRVVKNRLDADPKFAPFP
jgi:cation diffusion facilitator CzcD-associated flavoprotein CzcO